MAVAVPAAADAAALQLLYVSVSRALAGFFGLAADGPVGGAVAYVVVLFGRHLFLFLGDIEEKELPDDGGHAEECQAVTHVEHGVADGELACVAVHRDDEPQPVGLHQRATPVLVEMSVSRKRGV